MTEFGSKNHTPSELNGGLKIKLNNGFNPLWKHWFSDTPVRYIGVIKRIRLFINMWDL